MKYPLTSLLLSAAVAAFGQDMVCHINGTTSDPATKSILIIEDGKDPRTLLEYISVPVVDGRFTYDLSTDGLRLFNIIPQNQYEHGTWMVAQFIAENQQLDVTLGDGNASPTLIGDGAETQKERELRRLSDEKYLPLFRRFEAQQDSILAIAEAAEVDAWTDDNPLVVSFREIDRKYDEALNAMRADRLQLVADNPCFWGLTQIRNLLESGPLAAQAAAVYQSVYKPLYGGHPYSAEIEQLIAAKDLIPGNKYIDYEVTAADGSDVMLSSLFSGKVIYIDLWASWCGPCRKHARELIPIYEKYKDRGFQIIGIAREKEAEHLAAALAKEQYPWLNLLELNDKHNIWLKNGLNRAAGGGFLIAADGTILAVYPTAAETDQLLHQFLATMQN
jgi:thiol-disulfide isomerase/thioredoxin